MTGDEHVSSGADELTALRARNEQLETSLKEARASAEKQLVHLELKAEALKSGMVDLDGLKLIEHSDVSVDENGQVRGVAAVMSRMRRDKPWLFTPASSSSFASIPANVPSKAKLATEMSLDEWRTARAELLRRR